MGVVYEALEPRTQRRVALKVLRLESSRRSTAHERLRREALALTRLSHPGLVPCYGAHFGPDGCFVVLEFVEGESLAALLERSGPLPLDQALRIMLDVGDALAYVHGEGLLHRDLKPENVLLSSSGRVVLSDFGLTKLLSEGLDDTTLDSLTQDGAMLGTPGFWPPEQAHGELAKIGTASDVYSWGATLYALLSGHAPRGGHTLSELAAAFSRRPPSVHTLRPELPAWVDRLLQRCLATDTTQRPTLEEALGELRRGGRAEGGGSRRLAGGVALGALTALALGSVGLALSVLGGVAPVEPSPEAGEQPSPEPGEQPSPEAGEVLTAAVQALEAGRLDEALTRVERALELEPESALAHLVRSQCMWRLGRLDEAEEDCERALALDPENAQAYAVRGDVWRSRGEPALALADYDRALELDPRAPVAHATRGVALQELGRKDEALLAFERAAELRPTFKEAHLGVADMARGLGRYEQALDAYDRALELDPEQARPLVYRGQVKQSLGRPEEALADMKRGLELDPSFASGWSLLGSARLELGQLVEAIEDLGRALELDPQLADLRVARGMVRLDLGQVDEAQRDFERALEDGTQLAQALLGLGEVCFARGRYAEAIERYDRALELEPTLVQALASRGKARQRLGRHARAIEDFDRALGLLDGEAEKAQLVQRLKAQSVTAQQAE